MENEVFQNDCPIWPEPISPLASSSSSLLLQYHHQQPLRQTRFPGNDCGWDWPEGLSGNARMHILSIQERTISSDVSIQHLNSRHYRKEDLWNFKCDDKNFNQQNFDGLLKDRDSISSKCELKLGQPSEKSWTQGSESFKSYQTGALYEAKSSVLANHLLKLGFSRETMFLSILDRKGIQSDPKHTPGCFGSTNFSSLHGSHSGSISAHHGLLSPVKDLEQHIFPKAASGIMDGNHAMVGKKILEPFIAKGDDEIGMEFKDSVLFGKKINDKGLGCSLDNCNNAAELNLNCFPIFSEGENMKMLAAQDLIESFKNNPVHTSTRSIHESQMFKMSCDETCNFFGSASPGGTKGVSRSQKTQLTHWIGAEINALAPFTGLLKNYNVSDLSQKAEFAKAKKCQHLYDVYPNDQSLLRRVLFNSSQLRDVPRKMTASCDICKKKSLVDEGSGISSNCKKCVFSPATLSHARDFHGYRQWEDFEIENHAKSKINNETLENFKLLKRKRFHSSVPRSSKVHIDKSNLGNSFTGTSSGHQSIFFKQKVKPIVCHKYGIITNGGPLKQTRIVSMKNVLIAAKRDIITEHYEVQGLFQSEVEGSNGDKVGFCGCHVDHATVKQSNADDCTTGKEEDFTCSRTEGYKGQECFSSWCSVSHCHDGDYRCRVPQDHLNVWLHIHTHKSFPRGHLDSWKAEFQYDSREQYARFKQSKGWKHLLVYKSIIHGLGLYTSQFIPRGSMVVEYLGEVVGPRVADKRETEYQSGKKMQYKGACYLFKLDKENIIDGTRKGGIARFVNHSCLPNCVAKVISVRNEKKVVFYANREIYPGEEVTYDYHFKKEDACEKIPCNCRSRNCRRYLN